MEWIKRLFQKKEKENRYFVSVRVWGHSCAEDRPRDYWITSTPSELRHKISMSVSGRFDILAITKL